MNELLREVISYILEKGESERKTREVGTTWQTDSGKWSAKSSKRTQGGFDSEEAAEAWLKGTGPAPDAEVGDATSSTDKKEKKPSGQQDKKGAGKKSKTDGEAKPKVTAAADITPSIGADVSSGPSVTPSVGGGDGTGAGIFSKLRKSLGSITKKLVDLRQRGEGGAGGAPASQGESLFTQFGNLLRERGGISGLLSQAKPALVKKFSTRPEKLGKEDKKLANVRQTIAKDFGWESYDDTNPDDREKIAKYIALREQHVTDEINKAAKACKNKEEHVFCKGGKQGFGQSESAYRQWLEAAFDGSVRMDAHIRSGGTRLDSSAEWTVMQSTTSKEAEAGGYSPDALVRAQLEKALSDATSDEDRKHYEYQLKLFEKLGYHDTFAVGSDKNGRLSVVHISNKKSSDLDDPHRNSTPQEKLTELREKYATNPAMQDAAAEMVGVLDGQLEVVGDIKTGSVKIAANLEVTDDMVTLVESPFMAPYMKKVDDLAKSTRKGSFGAWVTQNGQAWDTMDTKEKITMMQEYMKQNPTDTYSSFGYFFVKMGEYAGTKKIMRSVFGTDEAEGLGGVESLKRTEADAVGETYQVVVDKLRELDAKEGHKSTTSNGRHVQTYVDSVLSALHFDTYIDNFDKDMVLSMGRHAVTPKEIRETLMEIMPPTDPPIDIETPEGKASLKKYLREHSRVDATSGALVISTPDGECSIGEDVWRTAGKTAKVASGLGQCFRQKLRARTSEKEVNFLQ